MAERSSPKGNNGDFGKKLQRQLSRSKEKVRQRLGKTMESRDDHFEQCFRQFNDQQTDGNRMYKDLRNYINAVRDMREASRRLSQSLFDSYESDWAGEEDLGAIVEGEDLLWNDLEVKLLDQAVHTMESYVSQFPDVREKVAKRGRKLVDYDSSRHHLEALQTAKKRDDVKIHKAEEEMNTAKSVYDGINTELKQELPSLFESRIGCFVTVFSAVSNLRDIFYKEMSMLNLDLKNVMNELHAQHPDKTFALNRIQRHGSLKRRSLTSPKAWKASFSEFHKGYSPRPGQRFSFRSPDKPRHSTLSRESSMREVSISQSGDLDAGSSHGEVYSSHAQGDAAAGNGLGSGGDGNDAEEATGLKEEASGPKPHAGSGNHGESGKTPPSESSCELNNSVGSESSELQLSAADNGPLHIDEGEDGSPGGGTPEPRAVENSEASGLHSDTQGPGLPHKDAAAEKQASPDSKSTEV
uniref:Bridging integrator 2a n=2 Tax=Gasterosteus aculeatus TaxID=69293 RepID=G3P9Y9_GASAC|nr:bridging integrator 2a [Gasterosteus aculeatus aculeatus]XP_040049466.1 bridging integrator 2a [Gasterosteus aculeatus aculeatus]XP_040049468.1 bridging integrator 2a [Gasterosteus aculeatus aculeatus]